MLGLEFRFHKLNDIVSCFPKTGNLEPCTLSTAS